MPGASRGPRGSSGPRRHPAAELASLLVRSVSYEAPALRKQISRCQQAQQDFARREEECQLAAAELRERFYASCKQYGITVSPRPCVGTPCPRGVTTAPCYPWGELGVEGDASAPAQLWERGVKLSRGVCARASPAQHVPAPSPGRQRAPGAAGPGEGAALAALRGRGGSRRAHRGHRAVRGLRGVRVREVGTGAGRLGVSPSGTLLGRGTSGAPCPAPDTDVPAAPTSSAEPVLPLLRHVGRRGNTTVYEWRTGLEPVRVERPEVQEVPEQPKEDAVRAGPVVLGAVGLCCSGLGR